MKENGKDVAASKVIRIRVAVKGRELHELRKAFGLVDAADLARKLYQVRDLEIFLLYSPGSLSCCSIRTVPLVLGEMPRNLLRLAYKGGVPFL